VKNDTGVVQSIRAVGEQGKDGSVGCKTIWNSVGILGIGTTVVVVIRRGEGVTYLILESGLQSEVAAVSLQGVTGFYASDIWI
jgi:hypothetical protein